MRWWTAAWGLARELKLGRELPPGPSPATQENMDTDTADDGEGGIGGSGYVGEEEREERRRIWWLLYIVDRHLALVCCNPWTMPDGRVAISAATRIQPQIPIYWERVQKDMALI
ncbi:hypothetical protein LB505_006696 [Fusarium chuoi]|nr:hypothetical protein LB505_006696 [Fusarium chuoi]